MKLIDFIHADTDVKRQELDNILHSKEEKYSEKRKEIRLFKTRTILMIVVFFFVIAGVNWIYGRLPNTKIEALANFYTDENSLKMTQLVVASKVSVLMGAILLFSKPVVALLIVFKNLVEILIAIIKMIIKGLRRFANSWKDAIPNDNIVEKQMSISPEEPKISKQEKQYMKQLMKEQLEFGLKKYGLLIADDLENAPKKGIEIVEVIKGPTITRYWVNPNDVLVKEINSKLDDIALAMGVQSVSMTQERGKLFLEVPNLPEARETVYFKTVYDEFIKIVKHPLEIPIGVTASGEILKVALNKCPHLLIAGATGSGKSVSVNEILCSIILNASPKEVRLILADPKRVELSSYEGLPHLVKPIAKDIKDIIEVLQYSVTVMERRYELLEEAKVKNIEAYRAKGHELPYLVVVVDEMASVMEQDPKAVEGCVRRLSGEARAAGIHLILATQRPSVDVITGVIKANLPSAIAFATKSNTDSRVILDQPGAEKLLGEGDGLLMLPDRATLTRFQGAFLEDEEIELIIDTAKEEYGSAQMSKAWRETKEPKPAARPASEERPENRTPKRVKIIVDQDEDQIKSDESEAKIIEKTEVFKDVEENVDAQLLSLICKEKIKGESVLPGTIELTNILEKRKSDILEGINHLIDKGHLERSGGGRGSKTKILIGRSDAIHYLFDADPSGYEEVYEYINQEAE